MESSSQTLTEALRANSRHGSAAAHHLHSMSSWALTSWPSVPAQRSAPSAEGSYPRNGPVPAAPPAPTGTHRHRGLQPPRSAGSIQVALEPWTGALCPFQGFLPNHPWGLRGHQGPQGSRCGQRAPGPWCFCPCLRISQPPSQTPFHPESGLPLGYFLTPG